MSRIDSQSEAQAPKKPLNIQRPKGTQDILGPDAGRWAIVEEIARELLGRYCYQEIRTPVFEHTELFERGVGETTDIVNKEMYTFEKSDRRLSLRPEGTASVVRAFNEHGLSRWPKPVKLYYMGPMFRYERPQAGRQRQFHQIGVELFGLDTPAADAEVILLAMRFFGMLKLPSLSLEINNIGTPICREAFKAGLRERVTPVLAKLCADCGTRYHSNPLRMLDCKNEACRTLYAGPQVREYLEMDFTNEESRAHFAELTAILDALEVPYRRNPYLVRGLDYYTKTVFEITSTHLGAQNAVCGGGRYNNLVSDLGGPEIPAVGWALGMERLMSLVGELTVPGLDYYVVTDRPAVAFAVAEELRGRGSRVEVDLSGKGFGKQLERAVKSGASCALIIGAAEAESGEFQLKNLQTREQRSITRDELFA